MPEYLQNEGVEAVLDNLTARAGVTAVAINPYVMAPADSTTGIREPPADAGAGDVRILDRPLWGKRALHVRTAPGFCSDHSFYRGLRYQPARATAETREYGPLIGDFLAAAKARGLKAYLQLAAAAPPGHLVTHGVIDPDDVPRLPDGQPAHRRVDRNGSLASPHIQQYASAYLRDCVQAYPHIDGIRIEWPEYTPYTIDSAFLDFGPHAATAATALGFDFDVMRKDATRLYDALHGGLSDGDLDRVLAGASEPGQLASLLAHYPGVVEALRFKNALVVGLLATLRAACDEASGGKMEFVPQLFPPPWNLVSGVDYKNISALSHAIGILMLTMHWPMMLRFYGDALVSTNPDISQDKLARVLLLLLDIADDRESATLHDFHYPAPDEPHPVGDAAQVRKLRTVQRYSTVPVYAIVHGYGPVSDFRHRLQVAFDASDGRVTINRYGYLSDEKLDVIGEVTGPI
jgi:hypothetical protein